MILVLGGMASGKRTYARSLGFADGDILVDAQELARAPELADAAAVQTLADQLSAHAVVLFCEVGCGVVPLDPDERAWRERAGRLACALAERASSVVRMVCGIPVKLK